MKNIVCFIFVFITISAYSQDENIISLSSLIDFLTPYEMPEPDSTHLASLILDYVDSDQDTLITEELVEDVFDATIRDTLIMKKLVENVVDATNHLEKTRESFIKYLMDQGFVMKWDKEGDEEGYETWAYNLSEDDKAAIWLQVSTNDDLEPRMVTIQHTEEGYEYLKSKIILTCESLGVDKIELGEGYGYTYSEDYHHKKSNIVFRLFRTDQNFMIVAMGIYDW